MNEFDQIAGRLDQAATRIEHRVTRILDGLSEVAAVTRVLLSPDADDADRVASWMEEEEVVHDADGYLARRAVLELARGGGHDPEQTVFYVDAARFGDRPDVHRDMYRLRDIGRALRPVRDRLAGVEWFYFQDARGWAVSFPMHDPTPTIPADFDWLSYFTYRSANPEANPDGRVRWTPPNIDYGGKGLMVAASVPVTTADGEFRGVWSIDVPVSWLVQGVSSANPSPGETTFLVDREGFLVAHPSMDMVVEPTKGNFLRERVESLGPGFGGGTVDQWFRDGNGRGELRGEDGERLALAFVSLPALDWVLVTTAPSGPVTDRLRTSFEEAFDRLGRGDTGFRVAPESLGDLEFLAEQYNAMARRLEETLEDQERVQTGLSHSQRLSTIGQLAGSVAHDFNNLLTVIQGSAAILSEDLSEADELLAAILDATERAGTLTTQLLSVSRRSVRQPESLSLGDVCEESMRLLRLLLPEDVSLELGVAPAPPVFIDRTELVQVLLNLVVNARDAVEREGRIRLDVEGGEGGTLLRVTDDGVGMSEDVARRATESFFTTKTKGTGLGLSTVNEISEAAGGRLSIESELGRGTVATLWLPPSPQALEPDLAGDPEAGLSGARVLLLDDDALVRSTTLRLLERMGAEVFASGRVESIVDRGREGGWDLLLTDVVMPAVGGAEAAARVRAVSPDIRVLFMTGYADDVLMERGFESGQERVVRKPFSLRSLGRAVRECLDA